MSPPSGTRWTCCAPWRASRPARAAAPWRCSRVRTPRCTTPPPPLPPALTTFSRCPAPPPRCRRAWRRTCAASTRPCAPGRAHASASETSGASTRRAPPQTAPGRASPPPARARTPRQRTTPWKTPCTLAAAWAPPPRRRGRSRMATGPSRCRRARAASAALTRAPLCTTRSEAAQAARARAE